MDDPLRTVERPSHGLSRPVRQPPSALELEPGTFAPRRRPWHKEPWIELALAGSPEVIEQAIYFALGCVITALAALAFLPIVWRRALRLTRARLQLQVPLSMQEILAERDQLRAEFAIERMRSEQALEKVRAGKTRDMAVIGRQSLAATAMSGQIASLRKLGKGQDGEVLRLFDELGSAKSELETLRVELRDAHALVERWRDRRDRDAEAHSSLRQDADTKRELVASLESRVAGLEARLSDATHAKEMRESMLRGKLETAVAHSARHESSGVSFQRELEEARLRIHALEEELAAAGLDAQERVKNVKLEHSMQVGRTRDADKTQAETLNSLRAENAALQAELQQLRSAPATGGDADDGGLRAGIHALGLAVARMSRAHPEESRDGEPERRRPVAEPSRIDAL